MRKLAIVLTSAILAFSAAGCQSWGTSSTCNTNCCKCCNKSNNKCCKMNKRCNKCCKRGR